MLRAAPWLPSRAGPPPSTTWAHRHGTRSMSFELHIWAHLACFHTLPGTLTKAGRGAARQRTGETQTPLTSQLLWGVIFHRKQTSTDFFPPKNWEKCKQQKQFHSVATHLTNAIHHCTFALLFFCFCLLRVRLLSQVEKSDFNLLSLISHKLS